MDQTQPIYINIPVPTKEEADKLCRQIIELDLAGTGKIHENVTLMWKHDEVGEDKVCLMSLKSIRGNLEKIHEFILNNHSWKTPCIEVTALQTDMC